MAPPTPGDLFERSYEVDGQTVEFLAEVAIDGPTLHLRDVAIFPAGADRASPGAAALLRMLRSELLAELRSSASRRSGSRERACQERRPGVALTSSSSSRRASRE